MLLVHEHQLEGRWALQAEKELKDILVMALPYRFSLGFLLKAHCASARSGKGTADPRVFAERLWPSWMLQSWQTYLEFGGKTRVIKEGICRACSPCTQLLDSTCIPHPVCYSRRGRSLLRAASSHL